MDLATIMIISTKLKEFLKILDIEDDASVFQLNRKGAMCVFNIFHTAHDTSFMQCTISHHKEKKTFKEELEFKTLALMRRNAPLDMIKLLSETYDV